MRGYTERTKKLREISTTTQPSISLERAVLETEFYEKYYGTVETPVLRALNFKNYMEKRKLYIGEGEKVIDPTASGWAQRGRGEGRWVKQAIGLRQ
jgi:hypothetical protein